MAATKKKIWKAADAADDAVVELIRTELQGRGRPLGDWQAVPVPDPDGEQPDEDADT